MLNNGSKIQNADGELLLEAPKSVTDLSFRQTGARLYIETTTKASELKGLKVKLENVRTVYVNEQAVAFRQTDDGAIAIADTPIDVVPPTDSSGSHGGIGSFGGGGSSGGDGTVPQPPERSSPERPIRTRSLISGITRQKTISQLSLTAGL